MPLADRAPGKLVVELTQQANAFVSPFSSDTLQGDVFTSFGIPFVDGVNLALVDSMLSTYVLRFALGTDLDFVISVLSAAPGFVNVEMVGIARAVANPKDPFFADSQPPKNQWGLFKIRAPEAWDRQTGSNLVNITVIDSSCDMNHPDLARQLPFIEFAYAESPLTQVYPYQVLTRKESA